MLLNVELKLPKLKGVVQTVLATTRKVTKMNALLVAFIIAVHTPAEQFWGDAYDQVDTDVDQQCQIYDDLVNDDSLWAVPLEDRISAIRAKHYEVLNVTPSDRERNEKTIARREFIEVFKDSDQFDALLSAWDAQLWKGTPPQITLNGDDHISLAVGETYVEPSATATDPVDGNLIITITGIVDTSTPGLYTITYSATDEGGQTTTSFREVEVYQPESIE